MLCTPCQRVLRCNIVVKVVKYCTNRDRVQLVTLILADELARKTRTRFRAARFASSVALGAPRRGDAERRRCSHRPRSNNNRDTNPLANKT